MTSDSVALIALIVSGIGLLVSITSALIAWRAKAQGKKAATLGPRGEAISRLQGAEATINVTSRISAHAIDDIQKAKNVAERVFGAAIRRDLDSALTFARQVLDSDKLDERAKLTTDLQALIARMNKEASLGR